MVYRLILDENVEHEVFHRLLQNIKRGISLPKAAE
jgi:hypothetical protein